MLGLIVRIIGVAALAVFLIFIYACCVAAGNADREMEEYEQEHSTNKETQNPQGKNAK